MRKKQQVCRAQPQKEYGHLLITQEGLFNQVAKVQNKEASVLKTQLRQMQVKETKVWSELHSQVGAKGKAVSATTPITSAERFRKPDTSSFVVEYRPKHVFITSAFADVMEEKARSFFWRNVPSRSIRGRLPYCVCNAPSKSFLRTAGPLQLNFWINSTVHIVRTSSLHVPKLPARKRNDKLSEKAARSVHDPPAAEAGTGRTVRRSVMKVCVDG